MMKQFDHDIEQLLLAKTFDRLTPAERHMVLAEVGSAEEYERMRNFLLALRQAGPGEPLQPPADIKASLMGAFDRQRPAHPRQTQVALLVAASVLFAVLATGIYFFGNSPSQPPETAQEKPAAPAVAEDTLRLDLNATPAPTPQELADRAGGAKMESRSHSDPLSSDKGHISFDLEGGSTTWYYGDATADQKEKAEEPAAAQRSYNWAPATPPAAVPQDAAESPDGHYSYDHETGRLRSKKLNEAGKTTAKPAAKPRPASADLELLDLLFTARE